ncbi:MAG: DEAD/DEAH box helicase [Desulfobacterales bacterium]|uniref:DEAD-box ATP-dependent RNA helicase RhpA n=1 Tax=Candidatus Desulfatibia vada TaxID=2841696 RepID=A0A8J6NRF7_9BACT|nr:DEAD/DEAH box helicase [Candidatus Desulfatibia vada]
MNFEAFNFQPNVAAGVLEAGYVIPTPIQAQAIPPILKGCDVMGLAQTGTGKTAAFVLPILNRLMGDKYGIIRALIMAPTRELAEQIHQAIEILGRKTRLKSVSIYGGVGINPQIQKLKHADIVVACPGRLLDHIGRHTVDLSQLEVLVIDEADQMFDMGFLPDIRRILTHLPQKRQTLLFSATMPTAIRRLAGDILRNPATVQIGTTAPADTVSHALYPVTQHLKTALLLNLLGNTHTRSVLVFTRTKHRAKSLGKKLAVAGYRSASLQGNLSQGKRQAALDGFRNGTFQILVATDIAARGIDVTRVSHVINYDIPSTPEAYIHRIGRTGRATRSGEAFTLVTEDDRDMVRAISRIINSKIERRTLSTFNYNVPASICGDSPQRQRKPHRKCFGVNKSRNRKTSRLNSRI